jgi:hypothetical protein
MAPSIAEPVADNHDNIKRWQPTTLSSRNIPAFLQTPYKYSSISQKSLQQKKKKAKEVTSVGGTTAIARTLMMQSLYLFYRTPIKV